MWLEVVQTEPGLSLKPSVQLQANFRRQLRVDGESIWKRINTPVNRQPWLHWRFPVLRNHSARTSKKMLRKHCQKFALSLHMLVGLHCCCRLWLCVIVEWSATQRNLWKAICLLAFVWSAPDCPRRKAQFSGHLFVHISVDRAAVSIQWGLLCHRHLSQILEGIIPRPMSWKLVCHSEKYGFKDRKFTL